MTPTPLFLHGAGCTAGVFASQVAAFANSIALNLPGHTTPGEGSSIAEFADFVEAECIRADLDEVVVIGNSMGGAAALELALRREPRVRAIVVIGCGAKLRVAPDVLRGLEDDFPTTARTLAGYFFARPTQERVDAIVAGMMRVGQSQTLRDFRACDRFDVTSRLGEVAVPVLALAGEHDVLTPPKFAQFIADRVPDATARILADAGHFVMIEQPEDTNEALRAFVNQFD